MEKPGDGNKRLKRTLTTKAMVTNPAILPSAEAREPKNASRQSANMFPSTPSLADYSIARRSAAIVRLTSCDGINLRALGSPIGRTHSSNRTKSPR